jgi:hypothetical protein
VRLRFEADSEHVGLHVVHPRTLFLRDDGSEADCRVRVRLGDIALGPQPVEFGAGGPWELQQGANGGGCVSFWTRIDEHSREPMMRLDVSRELQTGELVVAPRYAPGGDVGIGYPLDEYLMVRLLARRGAMVLHASAVADDGGAFVFAGHSGAGKSTISEIAERCGAELLSDDRTVLAIRDGVVTAAGTPWHGSFASGSPSQLPVKAIFLLEQAPANSVEPLSRSRAFAELLVRLVRPTVELAEQLSVVDALQTVVETTPTAVLRFNPTPAALDAARSFADSTPDEAPRAHIPASFTL